MQKRCMNCRHWQGTRYSVYGGCQHFVGYIEPSIFNCKSIHGWDLTLPFDPHDVKYFPEMQDVLKALSKSYVLGQEVVISPVKENDIKYILSQYDGEVIGERTVRTTIYYLSTYWDMEGCGYFETFDA